MTLQYLLNFSCKDTHGIIASVTTFLSQENAFIRELSEFGDPVTGQFFMRCLFELPEANLDILSQKFRKLGEKFQAQWKFRPSEQKAKTLILVSKLGHCLNDLLFRHQSARLPLDIVKVISNHRDQEKTVKDYGLPFQYFSKKEDIEKEVLKESNLDLIILARYMQILSPAFCEKLSGKIINIHHSFLPSFKGAKPYHQAFDRGVKIIGATAHYVTEDLDEGPIIEQEVLRVDHTRSPEELVSLGYDIETQVLSRGVKYHIENRVFLNGNKTVIFK